MKRKITGLLILAVFISIFSVSGCYRDDDEARVTIHIQRNDLISQKPVQQKRFIDSILEFFSTPAYGKWQDSRITMTLQISSPSFEPLNFNLPSGATEFTTTIPSGANINFTVKAGDGTDNMWGGHTTINLGPGDQDITIQMKPMSWITNVFPLSTPPPVNVYFLTANMHSSVSSYKVYKSTNINGPYTLTTITTPGGGDNEITPGTTYYYRVSTVGSLGESMMSDPYSWTY